MTKFIDMYISPCGGAFNEGYAHWEAVTVGGPTPDGRDSTNELTLLIMNQRMNTGTTLYTRKMRNIVFSSLE